MKNCSSSSEYADLRVFNHSCSWVERGMVIVMCLAQEHENIIGPGRESSDMCSVRNNEELQYWTVLMRHLHAGGTFTHSNYIWIIWDYRLSWSCKLATVKSLTADVSSVSPSSERLKELWVMCGFNMQKVEPRYMTFKGNFYIPQLHDKWNSLSALNHPDVVCLSNCLIHRPHLLLLSFQSCTIRMRSPDNTELCTNAPSLRQLFS